METPFRRWGAFVLCAVFMFAAYATVEFRARDSRTALTSDSYNLHGRIEVVSEKKFDEAMFKMMTRHKLPVDKVQKERQQERDDDDDDDEGVTRSATHTKRNVVPKSKEESGSSISDAPRHHLSPTGKKAQEDDDDTGLPLRTPHRPKENDWRQMGREGGSREHRSEGEKGPTSKSRNSSEKSRDEAGSANTSVRSSEKTSAGGSDDSKRKTGESVPRKTEMRGGQEVKQSKPLRLTSGENTCFQTIPTLGMELWLRSDELQLNNGDVVERWRDISGNGRDLVQSNVNLQPKFSSSSSANGWPKVLFGGGQILASSDLWSMETKDATFFVVGKYESSGLEAIIGSADASKESYRLFATESQIVMNTNIPRLNSPMVPIPHRFGDYLITSAVFNGKLSSMRRNGAALQSHLFDRLDTFVSSGMLSLGGSSESPEHYYLKGSVLEVIVYSGILRPDELRAVEMYLSDRYSVQLAIVRELNEQPHRAEGPPQFSLPPQVEASLKHISQLALWLASSTIDAQDRSRVSEWRDQSGRGRHVLQNDENYRPQFFSRSSASGWPALRFDGTRYLLTRDPWEFAHEEATIFIIGRYRSTEPACIIGPTGQGPRNQYYAITTDFKGVSMTTHDGANASPVYTVNKDASSFTLIRAVFDGQGSLLRFNGEVEPAMISESHLIKFRSESMLAVGACVDTDPKQFLMGDIAEIIIFDGLLSDKESGFVVSYLHSKFPFLPSPGHK